MKKSAILSSSFMMLTCFFCSRIHCINKKEILGPPLPSQKSPPCRPKSPPSRPKTPPSRQTNPQAEASSSGSHAARSRGPRTISARARIRPQAAERQRQRRRARLRPETAERQRHRRQPPAADPDDARREARDEAERDEVRVRADEREHAVGRARAQHLGAHAVALSLFARTDRLNCERAAGPAAPPAEGLGQIELLDGRG